MTALIFLPGGPGIGGAVFEAAFGHLRARWPVSFLDWPEPEAVAMAADPESMPAARRQALLAAWSAAIEAARVRHGAARAVLVGHSSGGLPALAHALGHAHTTAGLVLLNAVPCMTLDEAGAARMRGRLAPADRQPFEQAMALRITGAGPWREAFMRITAAQLAGGDIVQARAALADMPLSGAAFRAWLPLLAGWDLRPQLASLPVPVPVLALAGAHDWLFAPADCLEPFRTLPDARCHLVAGAGHLGFIDRPGEHACLLEQWLAEQPCPRPAGAEHRSP